LEFVATLIVAPAAAGLAAGLVEGLALAVEELAVPHAASSKDVAINSRDFMHPNTEPGYCGVVTQA
jgi:hypothetical protein